METLYKLGKNMNKINNGNGLHNFTWFYKNNMILNPGECHYILTYNNDPFHNIF